MFVIKQTESMDRHFPLPHSHAYLAEMTYDPTYGDQGCQSVEYPVCATCGAIVDKYAAERHAAWHDSLASEVTK